MQKVRATTMQRRLAAETLSKALEAVETGKKPAERTAPPAKSLHRKKTHYLPAHPALATTLAKAK